MAYRYNTHLYEHICTGWPVKLVHSSVEGSEMLQAKNGTRLRTAVGSALPATVRT